jgi:L-rhamnose mutarotase
MQRYGMVIGVRPEHRDEYLTLHAAVWPAVEAALTRANIRNFTIFIRDDLLFGYYEYIGDDHAADQARVAADPTTQRWWAATDPCQQRLPGTPDGAQWAPLSEVWHLD